MKRTILAAALVLILAVGAGAEGLTGEFYAAINTDLGSAQRTEGRFRRETAAVREAPALQHDGWTRVEPRQEIPEPVGGGEPGARLQEARTYALGDVLQVPDTEGEPRQLRCLYVGRCCTVWGSTDDDASICIDGILAGKIGREFDEKRSLVEALFGPGYDADGDGKTAIFCYDIDRNLENSSMVWTAGFFRMRDLIDKEGRVNGVSYGPEQYLLGMDAIHLDTYPTMGFVPLENVEKAFPTLVHEYQHLINYSNQVKNGEAGYVKAMELFLNEGFSMAAEHLIYGPEACTGRVEHFNGSGYEPGAPLCYWEGTLDNYANGYLFSQYLRTRYGQLHGAVHGPEIYKEILKARTPENEKKTLELAAQLLQTTAPQLVRDFWTAICLQQDVGAYGFAGETWAEAIRPRFRAEPDGIYNGSAAFYRLDREPRQSENLTFVHLRGGAVVGEGPEAVTAKVLRVSERQGRLQLQVSEDCKLYYGVGSTLPDPAEALPYHLSVKAGSLREITVTLQAGPEQEQLLTFFLRNGRGEESRRVTLTIPACVYPVTVTKEGRGEVLVRLNGEELESGTPVPVGSILTVEARAGENGLVRSLLVDGRTLVWDYFTVTGAHRVEAVFDRALAIRQAELPATCPVGTKLPKTVPVVLELESGGMQTEPARVETYDFSRGGRRTVQLRWQNLTLQVPVIVTDRAYVLENRLPDGRLQLQLERQDSGVRRAVLAAYEKSGRLWDVRQVLLDQNSRTVVLERDFVPPEGSLQVMFLDEQAAPAAAAEIL